MEVIFWLLQLSIWVTVSDATQCNGYNFLMKGFGNCSWPVFNSTDLHSLGIVPNMSSILLKPASQRLDLNNTQEMLAQKLGDYHDLLSKVIDWIGIIDPYIVYAFADVVYGYRLTPDELDSLDLPVTLAQREQLVVLYTVYFKSSCSRQTTKQITSCVRTWTTEMCNKQADQSDYIFKVLDLIDNVFCQNDGIKPGLKSELDQDLGLTLSPVMKRLGVVKEPGNPDVLNYEDAEDHVKALSESLTLCVNMTVLEQDPFNTQWPEMFSDESDVGAGKALEQMTRHLGVWWRCLLTVLEKDMPNILKDNPPMLTHIEWMLKRVDVSLYEDKPHAKAWTGSGSPVQTAALASILFSGFIARILL